jgi:flagellar biosynthesis chaperone FliJ
MKRTDEMTIEEHQYWENLMERDHKEYLIERKNHEYRNNDEGKRLMKRMEDQIKKGMG